MSQLQLAAGPDRLPWLDDEPVPRTKHRWQPIQALAAGALVVLAAASVWIGENRRIERAPAPATTVELPPPTMEQPPAPESREVRVDSQTEIRTAPAPEVRSAPERTIRTTPPVPVTATDESSAQPSESAAPVSAVPVTPTVAPPVAPAFAAPVRPVPLQPWPPRVIAGAAGRLVQVGAFGSRLQAKRGWWAMVRSYPAMVHLPAVVVAARNSRGRHFYRFQVGTTSQAHSEVLCQRMEKIRFSCAVIGLPWKPKGVER